MKRRGKKAKTEVFTTSWGQKFITTYDPALDNLPISKLAQKKIEEANRRLRMKPPPQFD
jgi:hypothetical protein